MNKNQTFEILKSNICSLINLSRDIGELLISIGKINSIAYNWITSTDSADKKDD